ncbi:MAG: hypothetical protein HC888_01900 [Candidatus Competibacteraceae bacterium]|nr:hypothetical protein [Candidatus Competibacteraceae bacterium]
MNDNRFMGSRTASWLDELDRQTKLAQTKVFDFNGIAKVASRQLDAFGAYLRATETVKSLTRLLERSKGNAISVSLYDMRREVLSARHAAMMDLGIFDEDLDS